jgi:hypothetical protein
MSYKALYSLNTNSCCCDSISILFYAVKVQKNPHIAKYYTDYVQNSSVKKGQVGLFQCPPEKNPFFYAAGLCPARPPSPPTPSS